ncbi:MAG: metallophosphoesterase, partial [Candidatus Nanoarchaeia archaeon]
EFLDCLPNAVIVEDRYLMVHGGISSEIKSTNDLVNSNDTKLEDILWSDPWDSEGEAKNDVRRAGKYFGPNITNDVLQNLGVKVLIRGHECYDKGYDIKHDGKVLTIFSAKNPDDYKDKVSNGAYLLIDDLSKEVQNAQELEKGCIKQF